MFDRRGVLLVVCAGLIQVVGCTEELEPTAHLPTSTVDNSTTGSAAPTTPPTQPQAAEQAEKKAAPPLGVVSFDGPMHGRSVAEIGNSGGGSPYREAPSDSYLVGFEVTTNLYFNKHQVISSVRPVFESKDGRKLGKQYGRSEPTPFRIEAKEGYAVGGLVGRAGARIDGFCVIFMKIDGDRLDPNDKYYSRWIGAKAGDPQFLVGGDGRIARGIRGRAGYDVDALGLVF